jgi:hypothetical protein
VTNNFQLSSTFSVYNGKGSTSHANTTPLLLILGVAGVKNPNLFSSSSIVGVNAYNPYNPPAGPTSTLPPSAWSYGSSYFHLGGYVGFFDQNAKNPQGQSTNDVYDFLGFGAQSNDSQNLSNWNGTLLGLGATQPNGYGIYVFQINAPVGPKGLLDVQFANALSVPSKTYVMAYAQNVSGRHITPLSTPFTKTALQYPEPSSWVLLSTAGFAAIGLSLWRRRRPSAVV